MDDSERVAKWRKNTKQALVDGFGGKCNRCGYKRCTEALDLHHIDPSKKSFGFGSVMANPRKWNLLVEEAKKCVLLCKICHVELHVGIWSLPNIEVVEFGGQKTILKKEQPSGKCAVCEKDVFMGRICCSMECAAMRARKIQWPEKDEFEKLLMQFPKTKIAALLGVSDAAVRKRQIKLGLA